MNIKNTKINIQHGRIRSFHKHTLVEFQLFAEVLDCITNHWSYIFSILLVATELSADVDHQVGKHLLVHLHQMSKPEGKSLIIIIVFSFINPSSGRGRNKLILFGKASKVSQ